MSDTATLVTPASDSSQVYVPPKVCTNPMFLDLLTRLRNKNTDSDTFRYCSDLALPFLLKEATLDAPTVTVQIETPIGPTTGVRMVPVDTYMIMRAGMAFQDPIKGNLRIRSMRHLGMKRIESSDSGVEPDIFVYYENTDLPPHRDGEPTLLLDPMLATGKSADDALRKMKRCGATNIRFVCVVAAPEGIARLRLIHPDVQIFTGAIDQGLNEYFYIVPGLGDYGDRYYGTVF